MSENSKTKKVHICRSCGKVMKDLGDFASELIGSDLCSNCTDEFGFQKRYSQVVEETKQFLIKQLSVSQQEAEKMALENVAKMPIWAHREEQLIGKKNIVITDVGSTTTKALLLTRKDKKFIHSDVQYSPTTVEKPFEDVNIGVYKAVQKLEKATDISLLAADAIEIKLKFKEDVLYISTSSAGGGLQILVIGLTIFDSASSGKRTAYGAGGVILDTFAIDDKRSSLEQMQAMGVLHPDIILMAGGVNGGAVSSILRLGEILQLANPKPKFGDKAEIPLIFAGNEAAQTFIAGLFQKKFDLYIVPNIRPTLQEENLQPAREKIHKLFMENVMEQAPGYSRLKECVSDNIIPTPTGVIRALQLVSESLEENVMAVDIGGATTDVFSNILGDYFRTVSANYGMSYSISNVLKDSGLEKVKTWLPSNFDKNYILNYIGNKMLYPTFVPKTSHQLSIEHAIAREAISMSKQQHMDMNFNTKQVGFLDKLKKNSDDLEKITDAFYIEKALESKKFHMHDINIIIGSGGALAHTENSQQALAIIYDGFRPEGITEIWKDRHFITPHLGKLSSVDETLASEMLANDCYDKIGLCIRPLAKKWKANATVMHMEIENRKIEIKTNEILYYANDESEDREISIFLQKGFYLNTEAPMFKFSSDLPIFVDTCRSTDFENENKAMKLYNIDNEPAAIENDFLPFTQQKVIKNGVQEHLVELPYKGTMLVDIDQQVDADTFVGENLFDPPKVYVISLFDKTYLRLNQENIRASLRIEEGQEVKYGQRIAEIGNRSFIEEINFQHFNFDSPVRGEVEKINYDSGTVIMREIQDYSNKPKTIKVAKRLNMKPKNMMGYMKKGLNDFVYAGDVIASKIVDVRELKHAVIITAPTTGTITDIDREKGTVTIQYNRQPYRRTAGVTGKVVKKVEGHSVTIAYDGNTLNGIIGFGSENWGKLKFIESHYQLSECNSENIVVYTGKINLAFLKNAEELKLKGVVAASIDNADLVEFTGEEIGVALTGNESIPFPLIITEGFGDFTMFKEYSEFLKKHDGKFIYINGHTQIRAGVTRPKMIVMD
jgi:uncharacterized protein (TIGR01319 family)